MPTAQNVHRRKETVGFGVRCIKGMEESTRRGEDCDRAPVECGRTHNGGEACACFQQTWQDLEAETDGNKETMVRL